MSTRTITIMTMKIFVIIVLFIKIDTIGSQCDTNEAFGRIGFHVKFINTSFQTIGGYKTLSGATSSLTINAGEFDGFESTVTGAFACYKISSIMFQNGFILRCEGARSCSNIPRIQINCPQPLFCEGASSCSHSHIFMHPNIANLHPITASADKSAAYSHITGLAISGPGAFSLYKSVIDSQYNKAGGITVTLQEYFAGFGAKRICRKNETHA
eukprot:1001862_1